LAMELPVLEDVGIKIMHKLNRKKRTNKIKDIIPTRNIKIELENVPLSVLKDSLLYFKNLF
jgi:hypothetical protein